MFSTSVLENIGGTNIYRLIFIVDFLAFAVISLVYLLVTFIMKINGTSKQEERENKRGEKKRKNFFPIKGIYVMCLLVALFDIAAWVLNLGHLVDFIGKLLPWLK